MALVDYSAYVTALSRPRRYRFYKSVSAANFAQPFMSTYKNAQDAQSNPTIDNALGPTSPGALFGAVPASGTARLAQAEGSCSIPGDSVLVLCDRIAHAGGLGAALATVQTTNLPVGPGTRNTSGDGVLAALEVFTQIGATGTTFSVGYTNQAGTSGRASPAIAVGNTNFREVGRFIPIPMQQGDTGFRSVDSLQFAATTGTGGNVGIVLYRPIAYFIASRARNFSWDALFGGCGNLADVTGIMPFLLYYSNGNTGGDFVSELRFIDV